MLYIMYMYAIDANVIHHVPTEVQITSLKSDRECYLKQSRGPRALTYVARTDVTPMT